MKYLVTGGAGFIGSHLVDKLLKNGDKVVVIDNLSSGRKERLNPRAKFYEKDIRDEDIVKIFQKEKPKVIFHYAAQTEIQKSIEAPVLNADINISGTLNVLESAKKTGVKRIIFASSVSVYGEPLLLPIKENGSLNPIAPYPITKLVIEKYLSYYQSLGLDFVSLRYSNVYGPRQSSSGEGGVVSIFVDTLLKKNTPIIYGTGEQTRDFLFVKDAISAATSALNAPPGSIYNAGTAKETTINELYRLIVQNIKFAPKAKRGKPRFGEIKRSCLDFSKIKRELGWEPKYTVEEGLRRTISWFQVKS